MLRAGVRALRLRSDGRVAAGGVAAGVAKQWRSLHASTRPLVSVAMVSRHTAQVTLNRPDALNYLDEEMGEQFKHVVGELNRDNTVRACVLTGAGRAFSAGGDLKFLRARSQDTPENNAGIMTSFYLRFLAPLRSARFPVVSAINGPAIGAGMCVAMATDIRVAAQTAKLGMTFVGLGLHPGMGGTHFLAAAAGPEVAAQMLLTGEVISGDEALRRRIVAEVATDADTSLARAVEIADRIATQGPLAVQLCVQNLRRTGDQGMMEALRQEAAAQAKCYASAELREGLDAMKERRAPSF